MKLWKRVGLYEECSRWYAPVYYDLYRGDIVIAVVGFHRILRFFRSCWELFVRTRPSMYEKKMAEVRRVARKEGYEHGHSDAAKGVSRIIKILDEVQRESNLTDIDGS